MPATSLKSKIVAAVAVGLVAVVSLVAWCFAGTDPDLAYEPAPFQRWPDELPRIIAVRDAPPRDDPAWQDYRTERQTTGEFLEEEGAIARATEQEAAAVRAEYNGKYAAARRLAGQVLAENPDSIPALIALAGANAFGDGNLPRALFLIRAARRHCEVLGRQNPEDRDACEWYLRSLNYEYYILASLDRRAEQVAVTELTESIYQPLPWRKIWPLIKLGRYEQARRNIELTDRTGSWRETVLNSRDTLAAEMQQRRESLEASRKMVAEVPKSPLLWSNHGLSALGALELDEAERAFLKSVELGKPDFNGTAYTDLSILYLQQGRFLEAYEAILKGEDHRALRQPYTWQQDQATADLSKTMFFLSLGINDEAFEFAQRTYEMPDRGGSTSDNADVLQLATALVYEAALQVRCEELAEQGDPAAHQLRSEAWVLSRKVRKLTGGKLLINTLRPYLAGGPHTGIGIPSWLRVGVVRFFPPNVALEAIRQARAAEDVPAALPYLDAAEAEVRLSRHEHESALPFARRSLDGLPHDGEKLLRSRVAAIAAECCYALGDWKHATGHYEQVLRDFPQAFRLLNLQIPTRITIDESPEAAMVCDYLRSSPRFRHAERAFELTLRASDGKLHYRLLSPAGSRLVSGSVDGVAATDEAAVRASREIHERLMSPDVDLQQFDLTSLDGSPRSVRGRKSIDKILEQTRPR
ncbi:MAG: hypothetical protein KDA42_02155 [Planctomycetales bacterium]|nr:hypothetical protein [Planctomycetales bacterium]